MVFTDQLTNSKGREDHVASGTHKRANRGAAFLRRTALKLTMLKGVMARGEGDVNYTYQ